MRAETVLSMLRRGRRGEAPAGRLAATTPRFVLRGALLAAMVTAVAGSAQAAVTPKPDPYRAQTVPAPDPAPTAGSSSTKAVEPQPVAPDPTRSEVQSPSSGALRPRETGPSKPTTNSQSGTSRVAGPSIRSGPIGPLSRAAPGQAKRSEAAARAAPAAASPSTSIEGRPLMFGGLALLALALASASLLHLVARVEGLGWRT